MTVQLYVQLYDCVHSLLKKQPNSKYVHDLEARRPYVESQVKIF